MMWTPQNIPAGWEVDSGYTTEDAARASAAAIVLVVAVPSFLCGALFAAALLVR